MKALTIKNIPDEVMQRFKAWAAMHNMSMSEALIEFMKQQGDKVSVKN